MTAVSVFFARLQYLIFQVKYIHRHTWKLLHFKNRNVATHPVLRLPPDTCVRHLVSPSPVPQPFTRWPHTWQAPAQNAALLEESTRIGLDPSEGRGEWVAQVVWDCPRVTIWYNRQFSQNNLNRYYVQNRILVVELVYNSRTKWAQPTWVNAIIWIISIISIMTISAIISIKQIHKQ